jgi:RNA polymerase sigma-70 factor (ECF subfamily)
MADERRPLPELAEAELVQRLNAHDSAAWAELYDRHYTAIWRYAAARTGSREAADDVAAQVFLEALQSIERFHPRGKPVVAWLYTIARNHAAKSVRRRQRDAPGAPPDVPQEGFEGPVLNAISIADALRRLTQEQRDVIALRHYAGCSTREIAAALGKNERAVYSTEARALAALRLHLSPESGNLTPGREEIRPAPGIEGRGIEGR